MNKDNSSKFVIIVFVTFILGSLVGFNLKKPETKEVIKEVKVETNMSDWKNLKEVDDEALDYCKEGFNIISRWADASANSDTEKANEQIKKLEKNNLWIQNTSDKRDKVLKILGY
jgi:hypothetical protein